MEWKDVVYGPVKSRRLGQSLGINLTPLELKVCNFSCGYCRVGVPSKGKADMQDFEEYGWGLEAVKEAMSVGLQYHSDQNTPIDYITIAGNGEPTMYPWFLDVVEQLVREKSQHLPDKPTAIFTNGTKVDQDDIRSGIHRLDRRFLKLDAGDEKAFRKINIPLGVAYRDVINNLLLLDNCELSVAVLNGDISNYESFYNPEFVENIRKMKFTRIFLYDIDIPKTTIPRFNRKIDRRKIDDLAKFLSDKLDRRLDEEIVVLWEPSTREGNIPLYPQQIN